MSTILMASEASLQQQRRSFPFSISSSPIDTGGPRSSSAMSVSSCVVNLGPSSRLLESLPVLPVDPEQRGQLRQGEGLVHGESGPVIDVHVPDVDLEGRRLEQEEERNQRKKDELQKRLDAGLISQEDYNTQMIQLDEQLEKKEREMERRQAQREKTMALIQVAIDTAMGIAKAVAENPMAGGLPGSAIMAAVGAAQAAAIAAQPLPQAAVRGYVAARRELHAAAPLVDGGEQRTECGG